MQSGLTLQRTLNVIRLMGLAVAIALLSFGLSSILLAQRLEFPASDLLFRLRGPLEEESATIIVAIDDASFSQTDLQWPWPRDYLAQIVENIASGNPRAIVLDIGFSEASDPDADRTLAAAVEEAGNVILANDISTQGSGAAQIVQLNQPIPELNEAAAALGLSNFPRDNDGTVRRVLAFQEHNDQLYFNWSLQAARLYEGEEEFNVRSADEVWVGNRRIDLESQYLIVNYGGPTGSIPRYSAYQVADGTVDPDVFEGKVVIVGATTESLHDTYPTPYGTEPVMSGVEIGANAVNTILSERYLYSLSLSAGILLTLLAALIGVVVVRARPFSAFGAIVALLAAYTVLLVVLLTQFRLMLPVISPMLALILSYIAGTSLFLYEERRRRAYVQSLFQRYVAPAAIDQMLAQPESYILTGQRREMTILFSDIRGFTTMSENLPPDQVVEILNEYLSEMTDLVFKYEGTVDKFEGDAILAFFNAPLNVNEHATKAVQCAMDMIERVNALQVQWQANGQSGLQIGIGINTGLAFVGNIGSTRRMDYTVIGDTVNLASRLQDLTKEQGISILFSETTRAQLSSELSTRFVTTAQVKGRVQQVNVYTVEMYPVAENQPAAEG